MFGAKPPRSVRPSISTRSPRRSSAHAAVARRVGRRQDELPELAVVNDQGDVRQLVDVGDGGAHANRVAARAFVLRQRADRADGGERRQRGARTAWPRAAAVVGRTAMDERENQERKRVPAAHGWDSSKEKAEGIREKEF